MQNRHLVERSLVKATSDSPGLGPIWPQVVLTQILHPDQALIVIMVINQRCVDSDSVQKIRYRNEPFVFEFLGIVLHENQRIIDTESYAIVSPLRTSFIQRQYFNLSLIVVRKKLARLMDKALYAHTKSTC